MKEWKTVKYVRRGLSHIARDTICQDRVSIRENGRSIAAVLADGTGSLPHSEVAAEAAADQLSAALVQESGAKAGSPGISPESSDTPLSTAAREQKLREIIAGIARASVMDAAKKQNLQSGSMDCTLAFVWVDKPSGKAVAGILGDGAVCIIWQDGRAEAMTNKGCLANMTDTVLGGGAAARMQIRTMDVYREGICGFVLTSDGLENELYMKDTSFVFQATGRYLNSLLSEDDPEDVLIEEIDRLTKPEHSQFDDDISVAVVGCLDRPAALPPDPTWQCTCLRQNPVSCTQCLSCGQDLAHLYRGVSMSDYGGRAGWFRHLNQNPDEERKLIDQIRRERGIAPPPATRLLPGPGAERQEAGTDGTTVRHDAEPHPSGTAEPSGETRRSPHRQARPADDAFPRDLFRSVFGGQRRQILLLLGILAVLLIVLALLNGIRAGAVQDREQTIGSQEDTSGFLSGQAAAGCGGPEDRP